MGKSSMRYIPNSKADMRYRRKAFERNKSKIESDDRLYRKFEKAVDAEKRGYASAPATNAEGEPILVHGAMKYGCENCGLTWWMFLEKGLEEFGENHKPVPFTIRCPVCGRFSRDISGICKFPDGGYRELPEGEAYFANIEGQDCGVPMTSMITRMFRG